jgi:hypothetical protein
VAQENQEVIGLLMRKEDPEVLVDIAITPRGIPIRRKKTYQFHPLSGSIKGLRWMNYEEK